MTNRRLMIVCAALASTCHGVIGAAAAQTLADVAPPVTGPVQSSPVQAAPVQPAPVQPAPVQPAPVQPAVVTDQPAGASSDIIITARKRGERALSAPVSVTVLEQTALQAANVTNITQLGGVIPGFTTMQGVAGSSAAFRGLGSNSADPSNETSVAIFIDGVFLGHPRDFIAPVFDVAQVEMIKGTQGTLLGKNVSLGAVSITNRRPGLDFGYDVSTSYLTGIDAVRVQGGVDIPLGGGFALRAAGFANKEDGYVRNVPLDNKERRVRELSGRLTLAGDVGPASITAIYQHDDRKTDGNYLELLTDPNGTARARATAIGQTDFDVIGNDRSYTGAQAFRTAVGGSPQYDDQFGNRGVLIASAPLGGVTLTAQTSYIKWQSKRDTDLDMTRARLLDLFDDERNRVFSQELRLASEAGGRLTWLLGGFYYDNNYSLRRAITAQNGGGVFPLNGAYDNFIRIRTEAWSPFGSAEFHVTDRLSLTAGLRYTYEKKTATYERTSTGTFALASQSPPLPRTTLAPVDTNDLDGNVGINFKVNPDLLVYASFSRGSKSGGFQSVPNSFAAAPYTGETADTYEAGVKYDLRGAGYVTVAVFDTKVDGFQVSRGSLINGVVQTIVANGDVGTRGFEASGVYNIARGFSLNGSVVYSPAKFLKDFPVGAATLTAYKDMPLPRAPRWTAEGGARYVTRVGDDYDLRLEGNVSYAGVSDLQLRTTDPLAPKSRARALLDTQVAFGDKRAGWELALIGTNLTDSRFVSFAAPLSAGNGAYYGTLNKPRTIAIQARIFR